MKILLYTYIYVYIGLREYTPVNHSYTHTLEVTKSKTNGTLKSHLGVHVPTNAELKQMQTQLMVATMVRSSR